MKKFIFALGLIAMAFSLTNCTQNNDFDAPTQPTQEYDLYVATPRTINSGVNTLWADGDALTVFHAVAESSDFVKDAQFLLADAATGHFKGALAEGTSLTEAAYDWYACYPYSTAASFTKPGVGRSYIIGNTNAVGKQTQTGNSDMSHLAGEHLPLVGVAKGVAADQIPALTMQHAASVAKFIVKNDLTESITINSIELSVPNHDIAGYFFIDFTDMDNISYRPDSDKTSSSTKLVVADGSPIAAGATAEFYLAVAPFSNAADEVKKATFTITATNGDGIVGEYVKSTSANITFTAGKFKDITLHYNAPFGTLPSVSTESAPHIVGFEESEGFTASSSYKEAETRYTGAEGKQWGTVYGTPSTTGKISGAQCMHIKTYPIDGAWSESYTFTNFTLSSVKEIRFDAKNENYNEIKLSYRTADKDWTDLQTYTLSGTNTVVTCKYKFDTMVKNGQFKFTIVPTKEVSGTSGKYVVIDNVVFSSEELPEDFNPVTATIKVATENASNTTTTTGTTATLNGSYTLSDATDSDVVTCGFEYRLASASSYTTVTATAAPSFSYNLTGLTAGAEYTFRAWATLNGGEKQYGEELSFTTTTASTAVKSFTLTSEDISAVNEGWGYADPTFTFTASDGSQWVATNSSRGSKSQENVQLKYSSPRGNLASPIVNGKITKVITTLKGGSKAKFSISGNEVSNTIVSNTETTQSEAEYSFDITSDVNQIFIRSGNGTIYIYSVTVYYE